MEKGKLALMIPPKPVTLLLATVLTVFTGFLDYITGRDLALSAFYLAPICWGTWSAGRNAGVFLAVASTVAWFVADFMSGHVYAHPLTPYWNALMLLILFLVIVYLLSAFQVAHCHLEEAVHRRTEALKKEIAERKRLEAAKLQAERLATVGTMAAQVAHEVRNPLSSITLNLDLIQKDVEGHSHYSPEDKRILVKEVRTEIQRIQRVIEDYLQYAKLRQLQRQPVVLNTLLEQKLAFLSPELEQRNVKLRTQFDPALTVVNVDAEQLWQAMLNLIRNSLDAMPQGGELVIGTWQEGGQAWVRVKDNGKGMNEEQLRQVFSPFFTTKSQGTGLGLTLVQHIAIEHGGHVECKSAAGKGSTFTIFLPIMPPS